MGPHVLLVAHGFRPDSWAGVEVYTERLASAMGARGWRCSVLTPRVRRGRAQYELTSEAVGGLHVHGLVQNYPYRGLPQAADDPAVDRVLGRLLDAQRPDLIAVQTLAGLSLGLFDQARTRGIPVVVHLHDAWWSCPAGGQRRRPDGQLCSPVDRSLCAACFGAWQHREGPLERFAQQLAGALPAQLPPDLLHRGFQRLPPGAQAWLKRLNDRGGSSAAPTPASDPSIERRFQRVSRCLSGAAAVLSPTRFLGESLARDGLPTPWAHHPTGVPPGPETREVAGRLRVRFLGTWVPHKGVHVFAEALASLPARAADRIDAEAIGPAPFPRYRDACVRSAQGRLRTPGALSPEAVPELLARTDVLVVPSTWQENAPLVVLEARAAGVPVLASDLGGLPELVREGVDGHLLPPSQPARWAERLQAWALDRGEWRALRERVRRPPTLDDLAERTDFAWRAAC